MGGHHRGNSKDRHDGNSLMQKLKLLTVLCVSLFVFTAADRDTGFVWNNCDSSTYANGSVLQQNVNRVLETLIRNAPSTGFNISSYGQNGNRIYGVIQCRADLLPADCRECAAEAKNMLVESCHNTFGLIQLDGCFLRHANYNFTATMEDDHHNYVCNGKSVTGDPNKFTDMVRTITSSIISKAPNSKGLFAAESIVRPSSGPINALAQCLRYVSRTACGSCLTLARSRILQCRSGAQGAQIDTQICYLRYEIYDFFRSSILPPAPTSPRPSSREPPVIGSSPSKNGSKLQIILGSVAAAIVLLTLIVIVLVRKSKRMTRLGWNFISANRGREEDNLQMPPIPTLKLTFDYEMLRGATRNFDAQHKLGEGGFGSVYNGILPDGKEIAVKRLYSRSQQGEREFLNETNLISRVQHRNLVKLLGCCVEGSERLLVYEYVANKSLDHFLFDSTRSHLLDWKRRYDIMLGTARGLAYLHEESEIRIIHRDIKASNILLDHKFNPKIADFGLAKLIGEDLSHVSTRVAGTLGYLAPEYALRGQLTEKADIFSFGVLILEIVSSRKNQDPVDGMQSLIERTWRLYESDRLSALIDATACSDVDEATRVVHIALLCTQASPTLRPAMSRVVHMLTSHQQESLPVPTKPAFIDVAADETPAQLSALASSTSADPSSSYVAGNSGAKSFSSIIYGR